jgi:hypothetical protein
MNADDNYHGEGNHHMADEDYADKSKLLLDIIDSLESDDDRYHINDIIITVKNYMSSLHDYVIVINNEIIIRDTTNTNDVNNYNHSHTHEFDNDRDDKIYKLCQNYFIIIKLLIIISSKVSSLTTDHLKLWKVFHQHFKQYHQYLSIQIIFDYCQLLHMYLIDGLYNLQQYVNHQHHQQQQHHQHNKYSKIDKHHDINSSNNTIIHDNSNDDNYRNDYNSSKKLISFFLVRYMYIMSMYRLPLSQLLTSSSSSSSSLLVDSIITLLRYQGIISYIHSLSSFNTNTTPTTYTSITTTSTTINNNDDDSLIYNANDIVICDELFMKNFEYICKLLHYNHHNDNDDDHQGRKHNNGGIIDDNARYYSTNSNKLLFLLHCIQHKSNNWIEEKTKLSYLIDGVMLLLQYIIKKENSIRRKEKEEILFQRRNDNHNINNDDGKDYSKDDGSGYIYECIYIFLQSMRIHCLFIDNNNTSNGADSKIINNNYDNINDDGMLIKYLKQFIKLLARFMGSCNDHNSIRRLMVSKT